MHRNSTTAILFLVSHDENLFTFVKEQTEAAETEREEMKNQEAMQTLRKTVIVSGILAVVVSVVFTIVKSLTQS